MDTTIDKDLDTTVDILDATESDDSTDRTIDDTIDDVTDAIDDVKYGDSDDEDGTIEHMEGIEPEEVEIQAESEEDAAEIELMNEDDETDDDPDIATNDTVAYAADLEDQDIDVEEED